MSSHMGRFELLVLCSLLFATVNSSVLQREKREKGNQLEEDDKREADEILDIANREYETEMGRIIAVNMAHMKRRAARNKRDSVFEEIERTNKGKQLKLYQGDIIPDSDLEELIHGQKRKRRRKRNATREKKRLWTSRIIPYHVPQYMSHITSNLLTAIQLFHDTTCLRFVPYDSYIHSNYILFSNDYGCSSKVGKRYAEPGSQKVSIGDGCNFVGTIIHELMHAIGFFHEQSRGDRNSFVKINWDNILRGYSDQFDKYSWTTIDDLGKDYDYQSIMHYDRKAFTKNGLPTIVNVYDEAMEFGTGDKILSQKDIIEINALYGCTSNTLGWSSWSEFAPCDEYCYKSRERYCYNTGNPQSCPGSPNAYGIERQNISCLVSDCPAIDGNWGRWSEWRDCSVQCGDGYKTRDRKCDDPKPMRGGLSCPGLSSISEGCAMKRCVLDFDDTDFESNMGMWTNEYGDTLDWQRHQGYTQTLETGPNTDHTNEYTSGYYLYVESSAPALANYNAKLRSPWLNPVSGGQCLKFFYFMYGRTMGKLKVHIEQEGKTSYLLFYEEGDKGIGWKYASKTIDTDVRYRLTFEAIIGGAGYSDIAIDDVYIDPGNCDCQDNFYSGCPAWAAQGDCQSNEQWMKDFCPRSCNSCPVSCEDSDPIECPKWAIQGDCETNPWMMNNCLKSCGVCECKDESASCPGWSANAYCETNPDYMLADCQMSCKVCGCKDLDSSCPSWAQIGECGNNPLYMLNNCCRSCRCENWVKTADCDAWALQGECTSNPTYMLVNCKKSCNVC